MPRNPPTGRRRPRTAAVIGAAACGAFLALAVAVAPYARAAVPGTAAQAVPGGAGAAGRPAPGVPPPPVPPSGPARPSQPGCGFFNVACQVGHAIDSWFAGLVTSAINPLFGLLGRTLLSTPQLSSLGTVRSLWDGSLAIADACYVLLVLAGGMIVMGHQTVQTSYAARDIAPRLITGFLAANLSLPIAGQAISIADGLSAALAGQGLDPAAAGSMLRSIVERTVGEAGFFFILLAIFAIAMVLILTIIYVARLMLTVVLLVMAPLALACHALPQTEGIARWWWRAFAGVLLIQAAQALVLVAAARVFFTEEWIALAAGVLAGPGAAAAFDAIQLLCLLYILIRIPSWIGRRIWSGGRSPLRSAARFAFAAVVLRRVTPVLSGRGGAARGGTGRRPPAPRPGGGVPARPAPRPGGRPGGGPGGSTGPGRGQPGGTRQGGSTGPGRGRTGGTRPRP